MYKRSQAFENYMLIRDTMTIRTWINMRNYSESLEDVAGYDNIIIDSLMNQIQINEELSQKMLDSLTKLIQSKEIILEDQDARISDSFYQLKFLIFTFGILIVLLIVFIILTIVYIVKFRKWKARFIGSQEYEQEVNVGEVDTLKSDIGKLKSDLDASKKAYRAEKKSRESIEKELRDLLDQISNTN